MSKVNEAIEILTALGLPRAQRNERSGLTLLALANVKPNEAWTKAAQPQLRIWDIMGFMRDVYGKDYAANSRETIRRQTIHQFEQARIVDRNPDDPTRPTNSGKNVYSLTKDILPVLHSFKSATFNDTVAQFIQKHGSLQAAYQKRRADVGVSLKLADGTTVQLSPGIHNELQVAIIEELGPCFAPGALVLYVGDTAQKHVVFEAEKLASLGVPITEHDKLPDVILYWEAKNWLFLIEAVTSHGPVSPKRHREIEAVLAKCTADRVYITAFLDTATFRKYAADIAWETEVWISEHPEHMIHFNGPKFLGPYKAS